MQPDTLKPVRGVISRIMCRHILRLDETSSLTSSTHTIYREIRVCDEDDTPLSDRGQVIIVKPGRTYEDLYLVRAAALPLRRQRSF